MPDIPAEGSHGPSLGLVPGPDQAVVTSNGTQAAVDTEIRITDAPRPADSSCKYFMSHCKTIL